MWQAPVLWWTLESGTEEIPKHTTSIFIMNGTEYIMLATQPTEPDSEMQLTWFDSILANEFDEEISVIDRVRSPMKDASQREGN